MKDIIPVGLIALTLLTSCEWITWDSCNCNPTETICGEPTGSLVVIPDLVPMDLASGGGYLISGWKENPSDTVTICDLPRTYFISFVTSSEYETGYDTIDWILPQEAFGTERRDDIQAVVFSVNEGNHVLRARVKKEPLQWSNWIEWSWTLTLEE